MASAALKWAYISFVCFVCFVTFQWPGGAILHVLRTGLCWSQLILSFSISSIRMYVLRLGNVMWLLLWGLTLSMGHISVNIFCHATRNAIYMFRSSTVPPYRWQSSTGSSSMRYTLSIISTTQQLEQSLLCRGLPTVFGWRFSTGT